MIRDPSETANFERLRAAADVIIARPGHASNGKWFAAAFGHRVRWIRGPVPGWWVYRVGRAEWVPGDFEVRKLAETSVFRLRAIADVFPKVGPGAWQRSVLIRESAELLNASALRAMLAAASNELELNTVYDLPSRTLDCGV